MKVNVLETTLMGVSVTALLAWSPIVGRAAPQVGGGGIGGGTIVINCYSCSPQVDIEGLKKVGPYDTAEAAQDAVNDGSAFDIVLQVAVFKYKCGQCTPPPDCIGSIEDNCADQLEYWIILWEDGKFYVIYDVPECQAWVSCGPCPGES